jgi:hypothetical protein
MTEPIQRTRLADDLTGVPGLLLIGAIPPQGQRLWPLVASSRVSSSNVSGVPLGHGATRRLVSGFQTNGCSDHCAVTAALCPPWSSVTCQLGANRRRHRLAYRRGGNVR